MLVLFMVLYHWLNYFVTPFGDMYKYLRFLTPSFIFITGFLISNVYLERYDIADRRVPVESMNGMLSRLNSSPPQVEEGFEKIYRISA